MAESPDFVAVGHVTKDMGPEGSYTIGGTVTYAALTAHSLGLSAAIVTSASPDLDLPSLLPGVEVHILPSSSSTVFENIYQGQRRQQIVHSTATPLSASDLPPAWSGASIALLGPVADELGLDWLRVFGQALVGVTPQGWMRQWDNGGTVTGKPWRDAERILSNIDVLVFSEQDVSGDEATIGRYAEIAPIAVVTQGRLGATVYCGDSRRHFPAFHAREVDPTGAGDVFAAAFLVRLRETGDPYQAAPFANCAAAISIEGPGVSAIPTRQQMRERLRLGELEE
jgi:1D-myo-inositol 3-kinase